MKFCFLTSKTSWLYKNKKEKIKKIFGKNIKIFTNYKNIVTKYDICFVISYFKIIPKKILDQKIKFVINHESNLPENRGFSPLYWQILEGKKKIVSTLFQAKSEEVDTGRILLKKVFYYSKDLLFNEIKEQQFKNAVTMINLFLKKTKYKNIKTKKNNFLRRRNPKDSQININKSIKSQFNLLRICDNENFPAFFKKGKFEYLIKIYKKK